MLGHEKAADPLGRRRVRRVLPTAFRLLCGVRWAAFVAYSRSAALLLSMPMVSALEPSASTRRNPILMGPAGFLSNLRTQEQLGPPPQDSWQVRSGHV